RTRLVADPDDSVGAAAPAALHLGRTDLPVVAALREPRELHFEKDHVGLPRIAESLKERGRYLTSLHRVLLPYPITGPCRFVPVIMLSIGAGRALGAPRSSRGASDGSSATGGGRGQPAEARVLDVGAQAARVGRDRPSPFQGSRGPRRRRGGGGPGRGRDRRRYGRRAAALRVLRPPGRRDGGVRQVRRLGDPLPRREGRRARLQAYGGRREAASEE